MESDHCLLARINFLGAMVVALGLEICKHKKRKIGGQNFIGGKNEKPFGYLKTKNLRPLRHGVGIYAAVKRGYAAV